MSNTSKDEALKNAADQTAIQLQHAGRRRPLPAGLVGSVLIALAENYRQGRLKAS